ncbi:MAG: AAA family ATPase, partial [candidate division WOR-3 bacterium]
MAKIISVINLKGGVGKTTLTMMFGEFLATAGKRVLLIDMDSQTNLTTAMMDSEAIKQAEKAEATVYSYIDKRLLGEISASESIEEWIYRNKKHWFPCSNIRDILDGDKLMIIPSSVALAELDDRFLRIAFEYPKGKIMHWPVPYFLLHDLIQMILLKESFDFILIDCPPNLSIWT